MKIAIGALVLCKVLISEPQSDKITTPAPAAGSTTTSSREATGSTNRVYGENPLQKLSQKPRIKEGNVVYTMIEGEVMDIKSESFYAPVKGTNKFEKRQEDFLVIKSPEIDHLVISSRACGLLSEFEYKKAEKKSESPKPAKKKVIENKEEVIVIRGDKIPEGFEIAPLDEETTEALKKEYARTIQEEERLANERMLKDLENDQSRFIKKNTTTQVAPLSDKEAAEQIREIEELEKSQPEQKPAVKEAPAKSASEMFDEWEAERKRELEAQRQSELAAKRKSAEKKAQVEAMKEKVKKEEAAEELRKPKKPAEVAPVPSHPAKQEKSIFKDALDIITNE